MNAPGPALWTAAEVAAATGARVSGDWCVAGVSIDSRTVAGGDLFVAIMGPNRDGHHYVAEAFGKGATAALVSRPADDAPDDAPAMLVPDTLTALAALGRVARARCEARIIGVTGSVGKTGTKEALKLALAEQAATHASQASYNNQWGVPLSLARMPRETRYAIFELGMNHAGELAPLARLVRPHVAIVTAVEPVHLEYFDSVAAIADAKAEIFTGLEPGGIALLNRDNPHYDRLAAAASAEGANEVRGFGAHPEAWARVIKAVQHPESSCVSAEIGGEAIVYRVGAAGHHWVMNSLAVLAAVRAVDADLGLAGLALARLIVPEGRGRRHRIALRHGAIELIDESYNANPASVRAALAVLGEADTEDGGRRIAVLGDMLELGDDAPGLHAALAGDVEAAGIDTVFTAGPLMAHLAAELAPSRRGGHAADASALAPLVAAAVAPGDVVMVKGSLGSRMREAVDALLALGASVPKAVNG